MPRIRLVVEDDQGQPLVPASEQVYVLEGDCDTLDDIDDAVEKFKNTALPQVEKLLLNIWRQVQQAHNLRHPWLTDSA